MKNNAASGQCKKKKKFRGPKSSPNSGNFTSETISHILSVNPKENVLFQHVLCEEIQVRNEKLNEFNKTFDEKGGEIGEGSGYLQGVIDEIGSSEEDHSRFSDFPFGLYN